MHVYGYMYILGPQNSGTPIWTSKYCNPYCRYRKSVSLILGTPYMQKPLKDQISHHPEPLTETQSSRGTPKKGHKFPETTEHGCPRI